MTCRFSAVKRIERAPDGNADCRKKRAVLDRAELPGEVQEAHLHRPQVVAVGEGQGYEQVVPHEEELH